MIFAFAAGGTFRFSAWVRETLTIAIAPMIIVPNCEAEIGRQLWSSSSSKNELGGIKKV